MITEGLNSWNFCKIKLLPKYIKRPMSKQNTNLFCKFLTAWFWLVKHSFFLYRLKLELKAYEQKCCTHNWRIVLHHFCINNIISAKISGDPINILHKIYYLIVKFNFSQRRMLCQSDVELNKIQSYHKIQIIFDNLSNFLFFV
jgi:hypothetical protein